MPYECRFSTTTSTSKRVIALCMSRAQQQGVKKEPVIYSPNALDTRSRWYMHSKWFRRMCSAYHTSSLRRTAPYQLIG